MRHKKSIHDPAYGSFNARITPQAMQRLDAECQRRTIADAAITTRGRVLTDLILESLPAVEGELLLAPKRRRRPQLRQRKRPFALAQ